MAPWSGSAGAQTFSRTDGTRSGATTWQDAEAANVDIVSDDHDTHDQDVADGINSCLKKDGNNTATADLRLGGFKVTGLGSGTASTDAVTKGQLDAVSASNFPSGTTMLFVQTAAPTGWTKSTTHNNKALRLVSGTASSGGTTAFTSVFTSRTIAQANLPNVNLSVASITGSVGTSITNGTVVVRGGLPNEAIDNAGTGALAFDNADPPTTATLSLASGTVTFGGNVPLGGSGTALDFAVQYVDVISAVKD